MHLESVSQFRRWRRWWRVTFWPVAAAFDSNPDIAVAAIHASSLAGRMVT
jgi:hypothetical protein